jgi:hypothetical protein
MRASTQGSERLGVRAVQCLAFRMHAWVRGNEPCITTTHSEPPRVCGKFRRAHGKLRRSKAAPFASPGFDAVRGTSSAIWLQASLHSAAHLCAVSITNNRFTEVSVM